jgi:DNA polymerase I-like protein with 3'-5' exonuclease and polymerase domains
VHDEVVTEVRADLAEEMMEVQTQVMVDAAKTFLTHVPVEVDSHLADYWTKE